MKKIISAILLIGLFVMASVAWANWRGDLMKAGMTVNNGSVTVEADVTVGDDLVVGDDAAITGTLTVGDIAATTLSGNLNLATYTLSRTTTGTVAANIVGIDYAAGYRYTTVLTFTNYAISLTDEASTVAWGAAKVFTFPKGGIGFGGAVSDVALTISAAGVNADWDGDFALGTATAANDATLSSTEDDLLPTTATPQAAANATTAKGITTTSELAILDGTTTAKEVWFNILVDDADQDVTSTPTNMILNGTVTVTWDFLGSYSD